MVGVVLAAGLSTRFDGDVPKQLFKIDGETLVCRTARVALASGLDAVRVVVGHRSAAVSAAVAGLAVEVIDNPDYRRGQSTSVAAGLRGLTSEATAAVFLPTDHPHLAPETLDRLIAAHCDHPRVIAIPTHDGVRSAPVLIPAALFDELRRLRGDEGARQIFARHGEDIVEVPFEDPLPLRDLDFDPPAQG